MEFEKPATRMAEEISDKARKYRCLNGWIGNCGKDGKRSLPEHLSMTKKIVAIM